MRRRAHKRMVRISQAIACHNKRSLTAAAPTKKKNLTAQNYLHSFG